MGVSSAMGNVGQVPVGTVNAFAGATAPSGWLLCGGQVVSRTQYSGLFLTIGTTYGVGDGSTTFALPDLRGRVIAGVDNMGGSTASRLTSAGSSIDGTLLGSAGGTETHTLTIAQMPSHTHIQNPHNHTLRGDNRHYSGNPRVPALYEWWDYALVAPDTAITNTTATNQNTGGSGAHQNTQPTIVLNYIIKAA